MTSIDDIRPKDTSLEEKLARLDQIENGAAAADLTFLLQALSDVKWMVRKRAAECLGTMGAPILEPLEKLLADGSEDQKFWVVRALVRVGKPAVPVLVRSLGIGERTVRVYAATALGEVADAEAIPHLVQALGDSVWRVRRNAYEALVTFGEKALENLRDGITGTNEDVVFWSAKALGKLGNRAREVLLEAVKKGAPSLRFILASALGETGDDRIIQVLIKNLRQGSWITQKRSADALAEIGRAALEPLITALMKAKPPQDQWIVQALTRMGPEGLEALEQALLREGESFRWDLKDAITRMGEAIVPLLERLLTQSDKELRFFAVACLGDLTGSRHADDLLLGVLSDKSWSIRKLAADSLAERGPLMMDRLNLALESGDEDLRYWVTYVFRKLGDLGRSYLIKSLTDANKNIAYFAAGALAEVRHRDVIFPLIKSLRDPSWSVRKNASDSLVKLQDLSIPQLINFVNDEDEDIQYWVLKTLKEIGRPAIPDIIRLLKRGTDEQRFFAAKALGMIKDPTSVEPLIEALKDGHEWVRLYAAVALGELEEPRALTHIVACLSDPGFKMHPSIYRAFERFGEEAVPRLEEAIRSNDLVVVRNAVRVLGRLRVARTYDQLRRFLNHINDDVRLAAVEALANFRDREDVVPTLVQLLGGSTELVRSRVFAALSEIGSEQGLVHLIKAMLTVQSERERKLVVDLILKASDKAGPVLVELLGADRVPIRKAAAELLTRMGERVRPAVEKGLSGEDKNVKFWAARVVKAIDDGEVLE